MAKNLIHEYCQGNAEDVSDLCEFFLPKESCKLLKDHVLRVIFEQGPCRPYEMLKSVVKGQLARYYDLLNPEEYVESVTFELAKSLEHNQLTKCPTLITLKRYLNQAGSHAILKLLEKLHLLTPKTCGNCIHLSRSKPFSCQRTMFEGRKGVSIRENPFYKTKRRPSDRACKDGFEGYLLEPLASTNPTLSHSPEFSMTHFDLETAGMLLEKRAEQAQGKKKRQRYERQFAIFTYLIHLFTQGYSQREAFQEIMAILDINKKMLRYDLQEIAEFFAQKNVL